MTVVAWARNERIQIEPKNKTRRKTEQPHIPEDNNSYIKSQVILVYVKSAVGNTEEDGDTWSTNINSCGPSVYVVFWVAIIRWKWLPSVLENNNGSHIRLMHQEVSKLPKVTAELIQYGDKCVRQGEVYD